MEACEGVPARPSGLFPRGPAASANLKSRPGLVTLLLALCLVPRAVAAWNLDVLWGDSLHYRYASICLEQGDFSQGFAEFGLNVYPLILIPLRHLGIDWQIAGKAFGVIIASLTVVPLWGWLRRVFDDRLAAIACCVYALHGKLIALSPLILRDSTFWFVLVLTLYYLWRAIGELRAGLFLAAGLALTLAVHTRTEGWLLVIPLAGWGLCRWPRALSERRHLILGILLSLAVIPAAVTLLNFTWLREYPRWEFVRPIHFVTAVEWWNSQTGMQLPVPCPEVVPTGRVHIPQSDESAAASELAAKKKTPQEKPAAASIAPSVKPPQPFSSIVVPAALPPEMTTPSWKLTLRLLEGLAKSCTWVGGLLLLIGLTRGWRILIRPEHLALLGLTAALLLVTRIRSGIAGFDQRYFMPIVILSIPWMAWGLDCVLVLTRQLPVCRKMGPSRGSRILAGILIATAVLCSFVDGPISTPAYMRKHADLGRWIHRHVGPEPSITANFDEMALDAYYANGHVAAIVWPRDCLLVPMPTALTERWSDVVVLWNDDDNIAPQYFAAIERRISTCCGYRRIDPKELPVAETEVMVFVKE
jgi:hypothetical protein